MSTKTDLEKAAREEYPDYPQDDGSIEAMKIQSHRENQRKAFVKGAKFATRWIPVSESLPKPNELVLVVSEGVMTFGHMIRPGYWEVIRDGGEWLDVSHWLQIPTLPPNTGEGMEDQKTFLVEYEIPPLRAIYCAECDAVSDADVRAHIAEVQPRWRIRKITLPPKTGSGE